MMIVLLAFFVVVGEGLRGSSVDPATIMCDGEIVGIEKLNDGYCDCGADEPGTSACSSVRHVVGFWCENRAFEKAWLPSSRVDDGICDCCDGSDEGKIVQCPDICAAERKKAEAKRLLMKTQRLKGAAIRSAMVCAAQRGEEEFKERQMKARDGFDELEEKFTIASTEAESFRLRADKSRNKIAQARLYKAFGLDNLPSSKLRQLVINLATEHKTDPERLKAMVQEVIGNTSTVQDKMQIEEDLSHSADQESSTDEQVEDVVVGDLDSEPSSIELEMDTMDEYSTEEEIATDAEKYIDDDDIMDDEEVIPDHVFGQAEDDDDIMHTDYGYSDSYRDSDYYEDMSKPVPNEFLLSSYMPTDEETPLWPWLRYWLRGAEKSKKKLEKEVNKRREALAQHGAVDKSRYGDDGAGWLVRDACVNKKFQNYKYEICLFGKAKQDDTSLGTFSRAVMDEKNRIIGIEFDQGTYCPNGPARSLKVSLQCGMKGTEIVNLQEPETCRYLADIATPLACFLDEKEDGDASNFECTEQNFDTLLAEVMNSTTTTKTNKVSSSASIERVRNRARQRNEQIKKELRKEDKRHGKKKKKKRSLIKKIKELFDAFWIKAPADEYVYDD